MKTTRLITLIMLCVAYSYGFGNGIVETEFDCSFNGKISGTAKLNNKSLVVGNFSTINLNSQEISLNFPLVRLNFDGTLDNGFKTKVESSTAGHSVSSILSVSSVDRYIVVGINGSLTKGSTTYKGALLFDTSGTFLGGYIPSNAFDVYTFTTSDMVVVGKSVYAAFAGTKKPALGNVQHIFELFDISSTAITSKKQLVANGPINKVLFHNGEAMIGGNFSTIGTSSKKSIAKIDLTGNVTNTISILPKYANITDITFTATSFFFSGKILPNTLSSDTIAVAQYGIASNAYMYTISNVLGETITSIQLVQKNAKLLVSGYSVDSKGNFQPVCRRFDSNGQRETTYVPILPVERSMYAATKEIDLFVLIPAYSSKLGNTRLLKVFQKTPAPLGVLVTNNISKACVDSPFELVINQPISNTNYTWDFVSNSKVAVTSDSKSSERVQVTYRSGYIPTSGFQFDISANNGSGESDVFRYLVPVGVDSLPSNPIKSFPSVVCLSGTSTIDLYKYNSVTSSVLYAGKKLTQAPSDLSTESYYLPITNMVEGNNVFSVQASTTACTNKEVKSITIQGVKDPISTIGFTISTNSICVGGRPLLQISNSQLGVKYRAGSILGSTVVGNQPEYIGNGGKLEIPLNLSFGAGTYTIGIEAKVGNCTPILLDQTHQLTIVSGVDVSTPKVLVVSDKCISDTIGVVVTKTDPLIQYQLLVDQIPVGGKIQGNGTFIKFVIPANSLTAGSKEIKIEASNASCGSVIIQDIKTISVYDIPKAISLEYSQQVCINKDFTITLKKTEESVRYQIYVDDIPRGNIITGNGKDQSFDIQSGNLQEGSRNLSVKASNQGCNETVVFGPRAVEVLSNSIDLNTPITASSTFLCLKDTLKLELTPSNNTTYKGSIDGTILSFSYTNGVLKVPYAFLKDGLNTISTEAVTSCGSTILTQKIQVSKIPQPNKITSVSLSKEVLCKSSPENVQITLTNIQNQVQYKTILNTSDTIDFLSSNTLELPYSAFLEGFDNRIEVLAKNECGASIISSKTVKILSVPTLGTITLPSVWVIGDTNVTVTVKNIEDVDFTWEVSSKFGVDLSVVKYEYSSSRDNILTITSISKDLTEGDSILIQVKGVDACGQADSAFKKIKIISPISNFISKIRGSSFHVIPGKEYTYLTKYTPGARYEWSFDGGTNAALFTSTDSNNVTVTFREKIAKNGYIRVKSRYGPISFNDSSRITIDEGGYSLKSTACNDTVSNIPNKVFLVKMIVDKGNDNDHKEYLIDTSTSNNISYIDNTVYGKKTDYFLTAASRETLGFIFKAKDTIPSKINYAVWIDYSNNGSYKSYKDTLEEIEKDEFVVSNTFEMRGISDTIFISNYFVSNNIKYSNILGNDKERGIRLRIKYSPTQVFDINSFCLAGNDSTDIQTVDFIVLYRTFSKPEAPNALTPGNDNKNDFFVIRGLLEGEPAKLRVFDRWGGVVYLSDNYLNQWNGIDDSGKSLAPGTYYYEFQQGESRQLKGYVEIIQTEELTK